MQRVNAAESLRKIAELAAEKEVLTVPNCFHVRYYGRLQRLEAEEARMRKEQEEQERLRQKAEAEVYFRGTSATISCAAATSRDRAKSAIGRRREVETAS